MKLGVGAFTDRSQVDTIQRAPLATTDIDLPTGGKIHEISLNVGAKVLF